MYKVMIKLSDFKMMNSQKRIEYMHASPERADLYIDIDNMRTIKKLAENISDNTGFNFNFYRIYFYDIPQPDIGFGRSDKKEIEFELKLYGNSDTNCKEDVEEYIRELKRDGKIDCNYFYTEFEDI